MNLIIRNTLVVVLAAATLAGGLFRPPYVEPTEAVHVPSIEILRSSDQSAAQNNQLSILQQQIAPSTITLEQDGQKYVPIRDYIEAHNGRLFYNPETASVDITIGQSSFSLLLSENAILSDGRRAEGGFILHNGAAYLSADILSALLSSNGETTHAHA